MTVRKNRRSLLKQFLMILPASLLGVYALIVNDVAPSIWLQNIFAMIFCGTLTFIFVSKKKKSII